MRIGSYVTSGSPTSAEVNCVGRQVARDPLDVELPMDGTRQRCGAIFVIGVSAVIWIAVSAVIALVLA